jgi:lysophospholipase L1-like esterase
MAAAESVIRRGLSALVRKPAILASLSLLLSLLVCVTGYEIYENVRYYRWKAAYAAGSDWHGRLTVPSRNERLMWEYRPNSQYRNLRTNRYGFRDRDYDSPGKPAGMVRIAFIGDSVTLGLGVDADDIFVRRFESMANEGDGSPAVQALNFGVDGYNTVQIHELLQTRVMAFEPDRVVYVMSLNDFNLGASTGEKTGYFRKPTSFFLLNLWTLYTRMSVIGRAVLTNPELHRWWFATGRTAVFAEILAMRDLLRQHGIPFSIAIVPLFRFDATTFAEYPLADVHRAVAQFCSVNGIPFTDLEDDFRQRTLRPQEYGDDVWHPNARGHRIIAEELIRAGLSDRSTGGAASQ